jgi:hypothetical protein
MFGSEKWIIKLKGHKKILQAQHAFLTLLAGLALQEYVHDKKITEQLGNN